MGIFSKSGTLEIHLDRASTSPGEILTGNIVIDLDERLTGCTLSIKFIGRSRRVLSQIHSQTSSWETFTKQEETLLENATFEATRDAHTFEMFIPEEIGHITLNLPGGQASAMVESLLEGLAARMEYRWQLHARLVVPGMFNDLKADTEVQIDLPEDRVR